MYYLYSLACKEGYYIGCTDNLKERLKRHEKGSVPATKNRLPIKLEFYIALKINIKHSNWRNTLSLGLAELL